MMPGGGTNSTTPTVYTGLNLQTSAQGVPVTLLWGKSRLSPNIFWYNNFQKHNAGSKGGGGKGGQKGSGNYTYTAAVMLGLCEGPIEQIENVWVDQTEYTAMTGLAKLGLTLFSGTASQSVWSYLSSAWAAQAIPYESLCYVCNSNYKLGSSAALPNHGFEVAGPFAYSMISNGAPNGDANPSDIVADFLTNPQYSIGLNSAQIDAASLAYYKTYCTAAGIFLSPVLDTQEQISQTLDRWASLTNSWIFWSGGALKFVPLGDSAIAANGVTYTPNLTIQYNLTYDNFLATKVKQGASSGSSSSKGDGGPVQVTRADPADCPNHVKIEIRDRGNAYNSAPVEWQDQGLVDQFGQIDSSVTQAHEICDLGVAAIVVELVGQRAAYIRNTYAYKVGYEIGSFVEPGDLHSLTDPHIGLSAFPVRVRSADEDSDGNWSILAEEFPGGIGTAL